MGAVAAWKTCETAISRTDGDAEFVGQAVGPDGREYVAAKSLRFRWNGGEVPPDDAAVVAAYNVLVQRLVWDGWYVEEAPGGAWWNARFRRPAKAAGE